VTEERPRDRTRGRCSCQTRVIRALGRTAGSLVDAVMPPTASRPYPVDLLLCGHHFWVSQAVLQAVGAAVYDRTGLLIMAGTKTAAASRPKPGRLVGTSHGHRS